ncbi:MAG: PEP-CTERM sorting domain-containing protein [Phycisphaeraceae bacterium]
MQRKQRKMFRPIAASCLFGAALTFGPTAASAVTVDFNQPDFDRYHYPHVGDPGGSSTGATFSGVGTGVFDDRFSQVMIGFNTAAQIAAGQALSSYNLTSAKLTAVVSNDLQFTYDPTYDPFGTYLSDPDVDAGRPLELYGVDFRNGFTHIEFGDFTTGTPPGYGETEAFAPPPPPGPPAKNRASAFSLGVNGSTLQNVNNSVSEGFDPTPFSIGQMSIVPGSDVPQGTVVEFEIDLSNPVILAYLQQGLADGGLAFNISALTVASQGSSTFPRFWLTNNLGGPEPTLSLVFADATGSAEVPEPATLALLGLASLFAFKRRGAGERVRD